MGGRPNIFTNDCVVSTCLEHLCAGNGKQDISKYVVFVTLWDAVVSVYNVLERTRYFFYLE